MSDFIRSYINGILLYIPIVCFAFRICYYVTYSFFVLYFNAASLDFLYLLTLFHKVHHFSVLFSKLLIECISEVQYLLKSVSTALYGKSKSSQTL